MFGYDINDEEKLERYIGKNVTATLTGVKLNKTFGCSDMFLRVHFDDGSECVIRDHVGAKWNSQEYTDKRKKTYLSIIHARDVFRPYQVVASAFLNASKAYYNHNLDITIRKYSEGRYYFDINGWEKVKISKKEAV